MDIAVASDIWSRLAEEGKAPTDPTLAQEALGAYTVGIGPWIDRLAKTYLQGLCKRGAHSKLVIGEYGGGKTHFLMALANRAHAEGYASAYVECAQNVSLANSFDVYRAVVKSFRLPGEEKPGLPTFARRVIAHKQKQIAAAGAPSPDAAFGAWLQDVLEDEYPEPSFGRVMAELLRGSHDALAPTAPNKDAALRWLRGEEGFTKEELLALRLAKLQKARQDEFGRNMLFSLFQFVRHADVPGTVLLIDEVETLFNARGKALEQVLAAMRVLLDSPTGVPDGVPLLTVFAAVPQVVEGMSRYPALKQRMDVVGSAFHEGFDRSPQIDLAKLGSDEGLLRDLGGKLIAIGETVHGRAFDRSVQLENLKGLAAVTVKQNLEIDSRRLFVKTWTGLLDLQVGQGERRFDNEELRSRYRGAFDTLQDRDRALGGDEI